MPSEKTYRRHGDDDEGYFFAPVEENVSGGGFSILKLFAVAAGLLFFVWVLRNSYSPSATAVTYAVATPSVWPSVFAWIGGILAGILGLAFIVVQCIVAAQDRREYWLLRLGRATLAHTSRFIRGIGTVLQWIWSLGKPVGILITQVITGIVARTLRALRDWKGRYYVPNSQPLREVVAQDSDRASSAHNCERALSEPETEQNFDDTVAGKMLAELNAKTSERKAHASSTQPEPESEARSEPESVPGAKAVLQEANYFFFN